MTEEQKLWAACSEFVKDQTIFCVESVYQSDRVIENAYEFIEKVCNIVGYYKEEDCDEKD